MSSQVKLKPTAGFCIKTLTEKPAVYKPRSVSQSPTVLEPEDAPIQIPQGFKIFVNIAWDPHVPAPPEGNEERIKRAMEGLDVGETDPDAWYVPVVVSEGRMDKDKAGKPSLVFDCIFNTSIKSRVLRDADFKIFVTELALQRIEAQTRLVLSREIGTPNIAAKGKLEPRTVTLPKSLDTKTKPKPLIEDVSSDAKTSVSGLNPKGILKSFSSDPPKTSSGLQWSWARADDRRLEIIISVPKLTHSLVSRATLDLEPRRLILQIPGHETLDVNLNLSDAEIIAKSGSQEYMMLKRQPPFKVDEATAEWRVAERRLVVNA